MKKIKWFIICLILMGFLGVGAIIYGKSNLKHLSYETFASQSTFSIVEDGEYKNLYPELKGFYIDEKIEKAEDLLEFSDEVVVAKVKADPILYGNSIIDQFEVVTVIKGTNLKKNSDLKVYENISFWNPITTLSLSGLTPVKKEETYILFLKKAPHPSIKNTYSYSSLQYGHINFIESKFLEEYSGNDTIKEIAQYDYVFQKEVAQSEIQKYQQIKENILQIIHEEKY